MFVFTIHLLILEPDDCKIPFSFTGCRSNLRPSTWTTKRCSFKFPSNFPLASSFCPFLFSSPPPTPIPFLKSNCPSSVFETPSLHQSNLFSFCCPLDPDPSSSRPQLISVYSRLCSSKGSSPRSPCRWPGSWACPQRPASTFRRIVLTHRPETRLFSSHWPNMDIMKDHLTFACMWAFEAIGVSYEHVGIEIHLIEHRLGSRA